MAPAFPAFRILTPEDRHFIENFTINFPPYSDFNFTSLWSWNTKNLVAYAFLHNNLVIRFTDYISNHPFYSFLGNNDCIDTLKDIQELTKIEGLTKEIKLLPEIVATELIKDKIEIEEDPDNFDYILAIDRLASYEGSKLKPHRNLVNKFKREHKASLAIMPLTAEKTATELNNCFYNWITKKGLTEAETENELTAFKRVVSLVNHDKLLCLGVYIDNTLVGFTVNEILHNNYAMVHFEKADSRAFSGIYQFIMQETAKELQNYGCRYINYQQDLGIPGLKQCKTGFDPAMHLKKYRLCTAVN